MPTSKPIIVIKYGGNAMLDEALQTQVLTELLALKADGYAPVLIHGGGPFIQENLTQAAITSEFLEGHRITTPEAMRVVEMTLKGEVNGTLVRLLNQKQGSAIGLSGKDGTLVTAHQRKHDKGDLGQVGNVTKVQPDLLHLLLSEDYTPVIAPIAAGEDGRDYNVNADMFAGHVAGALKADQYLVMTNVDGLMKDPKLPDSLIPILKTAEIEGLMGSVIQGGMIPKIEGCQAALEGGAKKAIIFNGMKAGALTGIVTARKGMLSTTLEA